MKTTTPKETMRPLFLSALAALCACSPRPPAPPAGTALVVTNRQATATVVFVAFGSDSKITSGDWPFCTGSGLTCKFTIAAHSSQPLPTKGRYVNATLSFGAAVACGSTKAEINANNPAWYDTYDVSLVDGYSNKVGIVYTPPGAAPVALGPPVGATGNEKVLGVFPYGCDVCVARKSPPCNIPTGSDGCKSGTQSNPDVPCQYQGSVKGGGGSAEIVLF